MGLFNTLTATAACPVCKREGLFEVQFKYGKTWQYDYRLGDPLNWSGTQADRGSPGARKVRVEAIAANPCPYCGTEDLEFDVMVDGDRITALEPVGPTRTTQNADGYVIVEV